MTTTTKKSATDELFAAYARTAPLEDLRFYLRYGLRKLALLEYPAPTIGVLAEMQALERELVDVPGTPTLKRRVWALIDKFKMSVPEWYGHAGVPDTWVEPIDSAKFYFSVQYDAMVLERTKTVDGQDVIVAERHEGPVPVETIAEAHLQASKIPNELNYRRVALRPVPLSDEDVAQLLTAAAPIASDVAPVPAPRVRKPKPATPVLACPQCSSELVPVAHCANTWGCIGCKETWHLAPARAPKVERPKVERAPRVEPVTTEDGKRQCAACETWQDVGQFTWGDAGRTVRRICVTCRKQQQRDAAARRKQAA